MKYITLLTEGSGNIPGRVIPFIFSKEITHKDFALFTIHYMHYFHNIKCKVRSAGFFNCENANCYGESETLGLSAHQDDSSIVQLFDYTMGM